MASGCFVFHVVAISYSVRVILGYNACAIQEINALRLSKLLKHFELDFMSCKRKRNALKKYEIMNMADLVSCLIMSYLNCNLYCSLCVIQCVSPVWSLSQCVCLERFWLWI